MIDLKEVLTVSGVPHDFLFLEGESLVQRARNNIVTSFLQTEYERLLFIDSDIEFTAEDVQKLWNLDEDICCGSYPFKKLGMGYTTWKDGKKVNLDDYSEPVPVDYAATGFLMINRKVFEALKPNTYLDETQDHKPRRVREYFRPHVEDDDFLPEDYAFSKDVRRAGFTIMLEPSIRLVHYGIYGYGKRTSISG